MYAWAVKRRLIYGGIVLIILSTISTIVFFVYLYRAPTCSDGIKNGDEKGVDCGGSCKNLCLNDTLTPIVQWAKIFNVSGDVYTAVAYIQNPNITSSNPKASYKFRIYDENRRLISEKDGYVSIPKNKMFAVFETNLIFKDQNPKFVDFEFIDYSLWQKDLEKEPEIVVDYGTLQSTSSPRITGKVTNNSLKNIPGLELDVFVLDSKENVVAASRSFVENLAKGTTQDFVFTWPRRFNLGVESCLTPVNVVLGLDRSGSMRSESVNPPEPFNTVLLTAGGFAKNFTQDDRVGVVSFGNTGRVESPLATNKEQSVGAISSMSLGSTSEQTNIADGLKNALALLSSLDQSISSKKVIVLLTDGIPTEPKQDGVKDYPQISAREISDLIKSQNIEIFTIGLGKDVSDDFLKTISTDENHYFSAPKKEELSNIYKAIGTGICPRKPNVITVIYRTI